MDRYAVDGNPYCPDWMSQSDSASKKVPYTFNHCMLLPWEVIKTLPLPPDL